MGGYVIPVDPNQIANRFSSADEEEETEEIFIGNHSFEAQIEPLLDLIPKREADSIYLYYIKHKRQADIAHIFNVTQAAISYRLDRGLQRIRFLLSIPKISEEDMRRDLPEIFKTIDIDILVGMWTTTCQSEVASRLGLTQGRVRHRFFRAVKTLKTAADADDKFKPYYTVFHKISNKNFNVLREEGSHSGLGEVEISVAKICVSCKGDGPFSPQKGAKDGLKCECTKCLAAKQRIYAAKHPEVWRDWAAANAEYLKARDAARYAADPKAEMARVQAWQAKNPEKVEEYQRKSNLAKYGILPAEMDAMVEKQEGRCPICSVVMTTGRTRTGKQVDHDHKTGVVRGILCALCNVCLGHFEDDVTRLQAAICYLERDPPILQTPRYIAKAGRHMSTYARNLWYGRRLTEENVQELLDQQGHKCAICSKGITIGPGAHIDHDHKLGWEAGLRGILCRACNLGLGQARDDVGVLKSAIEYLERHAPSPS